MVEWEEKSQIGGFIFIFDTKGFNFKQFAAISLQDIKCASMQMQVPVNASTTTRSTTRRSGDLMGDQIAPGDQIDDQIFDVTKI